MDSIIAAYPACRDHDLMLCPAQGVAYQRDMQSRIAYDDSYLAKFDAYDREIEARVNAGRCDMLAWHLVAGASVLDIGAGSGSFVRAARACGFEAGGFEVIEAAADKLRREGLYGDNPAVFDAVTLWDVIEHLDEPAARLAEIRAGAWAFISIPVFGDLTRIRESKHYRPGEHFYYWTDAGFVAWMTAQGFTLLERSPHETEAGREGIGAFAFRRTGA